MLGSPHPRARICSCRLLGNLAWFESTTPAVLELKLCEQLVFLLDKKHSDVIREATYTLSRIALRVDGAKGVVDAKALDHVLLLLESPNSDTRRWACELTGNLTFHEFTAPAILKLNPSVQLVSLLGAEDSLVPYVTHTLSQIARWEEGAESVVDTKALDHVLVLLESPNPMTRKWACALTGYLAFHNSTAPAISKLNPSVQLVSLLGDQDSFSHATYTLTQIARWVDGAKAVVDAKVLDYVLALLQSPDLHTRRWACELTGDLLSHQSTAPSILKLNFCVQLVSLLDDEDPVVCQATYTLSQIACWVDGAKGVIDAKVLDHVLPLLESLGPGTRNWACVLVHGLASHGATAPAILQLKLIPQLESLLQDPHGLICDNALSALEAIRQWPDGVVARTDSDSVVMVEA
ncbi:armadillo-type protein [Mycena olivaceomarginata]|nr:armadillo-type protein [Mycena olivaceomarginata]